MGGGRMARLGRAALLGLVPLLMLAASAAAGVAALRLQGSLDGYRPVDAGPLEPGEGGPRLARRVVVVVVDGLRADLSRQMPFLESLRGRGAWTTLTTGQPSFSKPGYAVLSTGTWQEYHGVTMNTHPGRVGVETVFAVARRAGLRAAIFGYSYWGEINPDAEGMAGDYPDHELYARARAALEAGEGDLVYVHLQAADEAAHLGRGALAQGYVEAVREIDGMIAGLASSLDLTRDVLVVTADHGHLDRNNGGGSGHGGSEREVITVPLVMAGAAVRQGEVPAARQVDVVPTVAALLGLPAPAQSLGRVLWAALDVPEEVRAAGEVRRAAQLVEYARGYVSALSGAGPAAGARDPLEGAREALEGARARLAESAFADAASLAGESMSHAERAMVAARSRVVWAARWRRLPFLLVPLAVLGLLLWKKPRPLAETLAAGAVYLLLFHVFYAWVFGDVYSLSVFPDGSAAAMARLFGLPAWLAAAPLLLAALWLGTAAPRQGGPFQGRQELVWLVERALLGPYAVLALAAAVGLFLIGTRVGSFLPPFRLSFLYFCALLQLLWLGPLALLAPAVTWAATRGRDRAPAPAAAAGGAPGALR